MITRCLPTYLLSVHNVDTDYVFSLAGLVSIRPPVAIVIANFINRMVKPPIEIKCVVSCWQWAYGWVIPYGMPSEFHWFPHAISGGAANLFWSAPVSVCIFTRVQQISSLIVQGPTNVSRCQEILNGPVSA